MPVHIAERELLVVTGDYTNNPGDAIRVLGYLKYVQAASATKRIATIQSDESLIPVFLAMDPF